MARKSLDVSESGALGGAARAAKLPPKRRADIARKAAQSRWGGSLLKATHGDADHPLAIGDVTIPCYVLEDGTRVLSQRGMIGGLGMTPGTTRSGADRLTSFAGGKGISAFVSGEIMALIENPIKFTLANGTVAFGYPATLLADLCDAVLAARKAGVLQKQQEHIADKAELLVRGFARVGIIALVDEATGYQDARAKDALARILEAFVAKEIRKWVHTFPIEYYKELCRLKGVSLPEPGGGFKLPSYFGHLTNDLVYARLAPGVLAELRKKNPMQPAGHRKYKHFQWLTEEIGDPRLRQHLWSVITLMKASDSWEQFHGMVERALPRFSTQPLLVSIEESESSLGDDRG